MTERLSNLVDKLELPEKPVVFDCGAYKGDFSIEVWMKKPEAVFTLFEPNPEALKIAKERIKVGCFYEVALSGHEGKDVLYLKDASSSLFKEWAKSDRLLRVKTAKLSNFMPGFDVDVLKINCEGAEYDILEDLYEHGWFVRVKQFVIQFHKTSNQRRLEAYLLQTHDLVSSTKWEIWRRKNG